MAGRKKRAQTCDFVKAGYIDIDPGKQKISQAMCLGGIFKVVMLKVASVFLFFDRLGGVRHQKTEVSFLKNQQQGRVDCT
jgi:hypothetical protein